MSVEAMHPITGRLWEYPPMYWLCGDDKCRGELNRMPNHHAYKCERCGAEWDAQREYELNCRDGEMPL